MAVGKRTASDGWVLAVCLPGETDQLLEEEEGEYLQPLLRQRDQRSTCAERTIGSTPSVYGEVGYRKKGEPLPWRWDRRLELRTSWEGVFEPSSGNRVGPGQEVRRRGPETAPLHSQVSRGPSQDCFPCRPHPLSPPDQSCHHPVLPSGNRSDCADQAAPVGLQQLQHCT